MKVCVTHRHRLEELRHYVTLQRTDYDLWTQKPSAKDADTATLRYTEEGDDTALYLIAYKHIV